MLAWVALALATSSPIVSPDLTVSTAAALFDRACLRAFPDDAGLEAEMGRLGATPLTADQAKVTLRNDPGRGWRIMSGGNAYLVFLELPPFHACSVRWSMPIGVVADFSAYRALIEPIIAARPDFAPSPPFERDFGGLRIHATGYQRRSPEGGAEAFYTFDQTITDPAQRARGATSTDWRFVRQIVSPAR